jgi:phytoene dehydrogenase-like protein
MGGRAPDAIVVGAGPNGLAAAIEIARAGRSVVVYESAPTVGGGTRSAELTEPGVVHDVCSAIHPLLLASPFFTELRPHLDIETCHPEIQFAHPLPDGSAVAVHRSVDETATGLGRDAPTYRRLMRPLVDRADALVHDVLGPLGFPNHPITFAPFAVTALRSAEGLARRFDDDRGRALVAGVAAHSMLPLSRSPTAGVALFLTMLAHSVGWPCARGGSQAIADAMARYLESLGGRIETSHKVGSMHELQGTRAILFDVTPRQVLRIAGDDLPPRYRGALGRYRYGPGVFKVDWALDESVPWAAEECRAAGTIHIGGRFEDIAAGEAATVRGDHPDEPYVLVAQQSTFDDTRAPHGKHTLWGYCHVPSGSTVDMTERIEAQIERFAPGFKDVVRARATHNSAEMESYNANYVGGDINGGVQDLRQLFARPVARLSPYTTPNERIFLCSSATPPGGGVHGMSGYHAARAALQRVLR